MKYLKIAAIAVTAIVLSGLIYTALMILLYRPSRTLPANCEMAVVFGAGITKASEPSPALRYRLDKALELLKNGQIHTIYISGRAPETAVMKKYLIRNKTADTNIISDFNGRNTMATVLNALSYARERNSESKIVFISQQFHLPRISLLVQKVRAANCYFIAADQKEIDNEDSLFFIARETLAYIKISLFFDILD